MRTHFLNRVAEGPIFEVVRKGIIGIRYECYKVERNRIRLDFLFLGYQLLRRGVQFLCLCLGRKFLEDQNTMSLTETRMDFIIVVPDRTSVRQVPEVLE